MAEGLQDTEQTTINQEQYHLKKENKRRKNKCDLIEITSDLVPGNVICWVQDEIIQRPCTVCKIL